jgi:hypothetical protein
VIDHDGFATVFDLAAADPGDIRGCGQQDRGRCPLLGGLDSAAGPAEALVGAVLEVLD